MTITIHEQDGHAIVEIDGKIVRENQAEFFARVDEVLVPGMKGVTLDFEKVEYLDSAGLGCCASIHKTMAKKGCGTLVVSGASPNVEKMWKLIRMDLVIPIVADRKAAIARIETEAGSS